MDVPTAPHRSLQLPAQPALGVGSKVRGWSLPIHCCSISPLSYNGQHSPESMAFCSIALQFAIFGDPDGDVFRMDTQPQLVKVKSIATQRNVRFLGLLRFCVLEVIIGCLVVRPSDAKCTPLHARIVI